MAYVQSQVFNVNEFQVKFSIDLVPADMKWLAHIAGS